MGIVLFAFDSIRSLLFNKYVLKLLYETYKSNYKYYINNGFGNVYMCTYCCAYAYGTN